MALTWSSKSEFITREAIIEMREKLEPIYTLAYCSTKYGSYDSANNSSVNSSNKSSNNSSLYSSVNSSNYSYDSRYFSSCYSDDSSYDSSDDYRDFTSCYSDDSRDYGSYCSSNFLADNNGDNDYR